MKNLVLIFIFCFVVISGSLAQTKKETINYLKDNCCRFNLEYYIFFEPELIEIMTDTTYRMKFEPVIDQQIRKAKKSNSESAKERKLFLHLFYNRVNEVVANDKKSIDGKNYLLDKLAAFKKLEFSVDKKFIEDRLNPKRRGLPFGDEECDLDYSLYTFFLYDPNLYVDVIMNSRIANPNGKMLFPTKCFLEELSDLPVNVKTSVQSQCLKIIANYKGANFDLLRIKIQKADLNARYD
jgi:hypothetical protein